MKNTIWLLLLTTFFQLSLTDFSHAQQNDFEKMTAEEERAFMDMVQEQNELNNYFINGEKCYRSIENDRETIEYRFNGSILSDASDETILQNLLRSRKISRCITFYTTPSHNTEITSLIFCMENLTIVYKNEVRTIYPAVACKPRW